MSLRVSARVRVSPFTCSSNAKQPLRLQMSVHLIPILPPTHVKYLRQISPTISRLSGQIKCHATLMPRSHRFPMLNEMCAKPDYFAEEPPCAEAFPSLPRKIVREYSATLSWTRRLRRRPNFPIGNASVAHSQ